MTEQELRDVRLELHSLHEEVKRLQGLAEPVEQIHRGLMRLSARFADAILDGEVPGWSRS